MQIPGDRKGRAMNRQGSQRVTRGVGLQPESLADRLLVKQSHPASKVETSSDKNFENLYES
eukprot:82030-Pelagomonas_calceolata.AAC.1